MFNFPKLKKAVGFLFIGLSIAMLGTHSFFTFVADVAPYNLSKGHFEVGFIGSVLFLFGLGLSNPNQLKKNPVVTLILVLAIATGLTFGKSVFS